MALEIFIKEKSDTTWTDITSRVVKSNFKLRSGFSGLGGAINFSKLDITYRATDLAVAAVFHTTAKQVRIKKDGVTVWEGYTEGNSSVTSTASSSLAWVKISAYPYLHALEGLKASADEVYYNVSISNPSQAASSLLHILWNKMVAKCPSPYKEALQESYTVTFPSISVQRSIVVIEEGTEYLKTFLEILKQYAYTIVLDGFNIKCVQPYADDTRLIGLLAYFEIQKNPTIKTAPYVISTQPVVTLTRIKTQDNCLVYTLAESDDKNAEEELYIGASHPNEGDYEEVSYSNDNIEDDNCKLIYAKNPTMTYKARYSDNSADAVLREDVKILGSTSAKIKLTNTSTTLSCYLNQLKITAETAYFADTSLQVTTASETDTEEQQEETTEWLSDEDNAKAYCNALKSEQKASTASITFKSNKLGDTYKPNDLIKIGSIDAIYLIKQIDEDMVTGEKEYTCGIFKLIDDASVSWKKRGISLIKRGADGTSTYIHVRYSDDGGATFTEDGGMITGAYMGISVTTTETAPTDVTAYSWSRIKGADGATGAQGIQGEKGEKGEKGDKGDTGAQGEKGEKGDTGATGATGAKGDTGATGARGANITIADYGGYKNTLSGLKAIEGKVGDTWTLKSNFTGNIGDILLMKCIITDQDNATCYLPCTVTSFNGKSITGNNGTLIYGNKGATGSQGYPGVIIDLSSPSIVVPADENGIVDSSVWNNVSCTVTVIQGSTQFTPVTTTPTENCTFKVSAAESTSSLVGFQIENGNTWQCYTTATDTNPATAMLSTVDSVVVNLTITYKDLNGNVVTVTKDVTVMKVTQIKSQTLWFAWSKSDTDFIPTDSSFWVSTTSFIQYNGQMVGELNSNGAGDTPYTQIFFSNWNEIQAARTEEYRFLWCKTEEDGEPFFFATAKYETQYAVGDSDTEQPAEDKWSYNMPNIVNAKYIWIRKKIVGSATWGEAVCSSIGVTFTDNMIRLSADEAYLAVRDGVIELNAANILAKGTITADIIDLKDLMAQQLILKGGGVIMSDGYDTSDTSGFMITADGKLFAKDAVLSGTLKSQGYELGDIKKSETKTGFYLGKDGTLEAQNAVLKAVTILDGTFDAGSLKTVNEETLGSWCATCGLPSESGSWSASVKTVEVTTNSSGQEVVTPYTRGTLSYNQSFPGYWKGSDFLTWARNNIPVNNNGFTALTGTIMGYKAYARRFSEETWTEEFVSNYTKSSMGTADEFSESKTIDCGLYYKQLTVSFYWKDPDGWNDTYGWLYVYVDGEQKYYSRYSVTSPGREATQTLFTMELSPGTHTVLIKRQPSKDRVTMNVTAKTSVTSVYGVNSDYIELRLYTGTDTTKVFAGGTSTDRLMCCYLGSYNEYSGKKTQALWLEDSFASTYYLTEAVNLTYNNSTFKAGTGMTGWTVDRYNKFRGLLEVGTYDESSKTVKWKTGTLTKRASCQFRIKYLYINGTLYSQYFDLTWNGTVLYVRSYDGTISLTYSTSEYYKSLSYISFAEVKESKGVYTSSIYPKDDETSCEIGSISNPYKRVYTEALMGLYPIGSIYLTVGDENPDDLFGGEWELLPAGYALWTATSTNKNGSGNTIAAGLPNLSGYFTTQGNDSTGGKTTVDGSLFKIRTTGNVDSGYSSTADYATSIKFDASAYNSIYGNSTTVQPPAYKIKAYRRDK